MVWPSSLGPLVEGGEQPGVQLAGFDVLGRGFDDSPPEQGGLVHLGAVFYKSPPPGMPAAGVDPAVDLDGDHVGGPGVIESPLAARVEQQLSDRVREADKLSQHLVVQGCDLLGLAHMVNFRKARPQASIAASDAAKRRNIVQPLLISLGLAHAALP